MAFPVRSRIVETLKPEYYSSSPLVPLTEIVHDRLSVEIMRGCTRGPAVFCNAGMAYRPKRARSVNDIVEHTVKGITGSGWEEVGLISLSSSDHEQLPEIVSQIGSESFGQSYFHIAFKPEGR